MNITDIRRSRLRAWFANRTFPPEEKSYLSQLIGGKASFGEKAARRLEKTYGMPHMHLDGQDDRVESDDTVAEFAWVYGNATDKGREILRNAIAIARDLYVERRTKQIPVVADRRKPR